MQLQMTMHENFYTHSVLHYVDANAFQIDVAQSANSTRFDSKVTNQIETQRVTLPQDVPFIH